MLNWGFKNNKSPLKNWVRNKPQFKLMLFNKNLIQIVPQRILFRIYKYLVRCYTSMLKCCNMAYMTAYIRVKLWQGHKAQLKKLLLSSSSSLITHSIRYRKRRTPPSGFHCSQQIPSLGFTAQSFLFLLHTFSSLLSCHDSLRLWAGCIFPRSWMDRSSEALILLCVQLFSSGMWFDEYIQSM